MRIPLLPLGTGALAVVLFCALSAGEAQAAIELEPLPVPDAKVPPGASLETVTAFEVEATQQTVTLHDVQVRATGSVNAVLGVAAVYLARDDNNDGYFRSGQDSILGYDIFTDVGGERRATLGADALQLQPGERTRLFVVVDLQPWVTIDATFGAEIFHVNATVTPPSSALPLSGGELYVTNNTAYMRFAGPLPTGTHELKPGAYDRPLTEMQARAYGHAMALRSLTFVHDGPAEPADGIAQIEIWLDTDVSWDYDRQRDTLIGAGQFTPGEDSLTIDLYDPAVNGPPWFLVNEPRWLFVRVHLAQDAPGGQTYSVRLDTANVEYAPPSGLPIVATPLVVDAPPPGNEPGGGGEDPGTEEPGEDNGDDNTDDGKEPGEDGGFAGGSSREATLFFCGTTGQPGVAGGVTLVLLGGLMLFARRRRVAPVELARACRSGT